MGNQCKQQPKKSLVIQEQDDPRKQIKEKQFTFGINSAENEIQNSLSNQQISSNSLICERFALRVELEKPFKLQSLREESIEWFSEISESFEIFSHQNQSFDNFFKRQSQEQDSNLNNQCETRNKSKSIQSQSQKLSLYQKQQIKVRNQRLEFLEKQKTNKLRSFESEKSFMKNINEKLLFSSNEDNDFNFYSARSLKLQQKKKDCSNFTTDTNSFKRVSKEQIQLNNEAQIEQNSKYSLNKQNTLQQLLKSTQDISSNLDILKTPKILK